MSFVVTIEFLAVISAAIYGVLLASRVGMDITGVFAVAFAMSFGGGTLRDLFLDRHPLFWIANPHYVITVFVISMAAGLILRFIKRIKTATAFSPTRWEWGCSPCPELRWLLTQVRTGFWR